MVNLPYSRAKSILTHFYTLSKGEEYLIYLNVPLIRQGHQIVY